MKKLIAAAVAIAFAGLSTAPAAAARGDANKNPDMCWKLDPVLGIIHVRC